MTMDQPEKKYLLVGLSLLLALLIFFFVVAETTGEQRMVAPLEYEGVPLGLKLEIPPPARIEVVVAGPRILLLKARMTGLKLTLDLHGLRPGRNSFAEPGQFSPAESELRVRKVLPPVEIIARVSQ
ncbi:hypothetical protein [Geotalea sp. SG265]|uniref:hypothetical protein n=1 Tax=Geotalea sp. SG265 TaxID=2922867 RepID=UPI001FB03D5D|nr:hypothetical protein [Geotalea sp. SG265]